MADSSDLQKALRRAAGRLTAMADELRAVDVNNLSVDDWLHLRGIMGNHMADYNESVSAIDTLLDTAGAQSRILRYLRLRVGEKVTKEELSGVAGIHEWARRVRELREDYGWPIHTSVTRPGMRIGEYLLVADHPDKELARSWNLAKQMKNLRTAGGTPPPKTRLLEYLKALYPRAAEPDQVAHVAGTSAVARRALADLASDGWRIDPSPVAGSISSPRVRLLALEPE